MQSVIIDGVRYVPETPPTPKKFSVESIGDYMRRLRNSRGWSLQYVADRCGCNVTTISAAERGCNIPRLRVAAAVATLFGITVDTLISSKGCAK